MNTHSSPVCFKSHVIGSEPIAINRAQNLTPSSASENFIEKTNNTLLDLGIEPQTSSVAVALRTTRLTKQFF